jgi:hypothetical protein
MKPSNDVFYGLDIQKEYISVVQYTAGSNSVTLVALQPIADSRAGKNTVSKELGILKSKFKFADPHVNCSLPAVNAVIKRVPVDRDETDIDAALSWELEQNIIGSPDDYVFDYLPCGKRPDNIEEYLIVAYRKERVVTLASLLKSHKLIPRLVDLDILALVNIFEASYPDFIDRPAIIVHAESRDARIILTHQGRLLDYELLAYDTEPDPQAFGELVMAAAERLSAATGLQGEVQGMPVFASGILFAQEDFLRNAGSVLHAISILHPFRKIECRIGVDEDKLANYLSQLSVAVGLAIRRDT